DDSGDNVTTSSFINIISSNDPPLAYDNLSSGNFTEDNSYSLQLTGFDIDGDNFTYTPLSAPSYGTLTNFNSNSGVLTFTPYDNLSANFIGSDNFSFLTTDNYSENSTTATIGFFVNGQNDPPIADNLTLNVRDTFAEFGTLSMQDPDEPDNHSYAIVIHPNFGSVTLQDNLTGRFRYQASSTAVVADSFQFKVTDSVGASDIGTVLVKISQSTAVPGSAVPIYEDPSVILVEEETTDLEEKSIILVEEETTDLEGESVTLQSNGSVITGSSDLEIDVTGSVLEEVTMRIPVPASAFKPPTEIRALQKLDGAQAIEVDTVNPASTEVTSALLELPPGTQTNIAADGTIQSIFPWGSNEVRATIAPRGEIELELVESIICVDGQPTRVYLPEGSRTTVQAQRLETAVTPEAFTQSGVQESILNVGVNGTIETQMPLAAGSRITMTDIPACSSTEATYTGALISELPPLAVAENLLQRTLTQNADGEVQMILRLLDADNQTVESPILLPKLSGGSTVEVIEEAGVPVLVADMPLYSTSDNASLSRSPIQQELPNATSYFVGRDAVSGSAIYLTALTEDAMVQVRRRLNNELEMELTSIVGLQGSSAIHFEDNFHELELLEVGETLEVRNSAQQISLPQGDAIFTFPTESTVSLADLEIRIRDAHSVWAWDVGTQAWQGYSPKLRRDVLISRELGTPRLQRKLDSGQGLWVYLEKPIEVLYPDEPQGVLPDTTNDPKSVWRLLGNNTGRALSIKELLLMLPDNVLALWRWSDGDLQVYSAHKDLEADRLQQGIKNWPEDSTLLSKQAYWVQLETSSASRSLNVLPPHP
ncbi:MAG: Ig-like domain-containing protein, partial [SAR324 cluster bacterium]|nr:Ig-like domain-containing protein [SAR324 cluster bacterium]